jgi:hypothetical protein
MVDRAMDNGISLIRPKHIEESILLIRGQRVMLDRDLAALYGVETKGLNRAVQRNAERFPPDFMFQLTADEADSLRCQFGTLKRGQHFKYLPRVFTQEGVAMLSSVLRSSRAIQVNIVIMRVFVRVRESLALHKELAHRLAELERRIESHDTSIRTVFEAIREPMAPPTTSSTSSLKDLGDVGVGAGSGRWAVCGQVRRRREGGGWGVGWRSRKQSA